MESSETILKASQTIAERLVWQTAEKDQAGIAEDLASGKDIPEVYGMDEARMFDEFFCFLDVSSVVAPSQPIDSSLLSPKHTPLFMLRASFSVSKRAL